MARINTAAGAALARINTAAGAALIDGTTHEGAPARALTPEQQLRRTVLACLLWENTFYESGASIAARIGALVPQVDPEKVAALAIEARSQMYLRHAPLLLAREMARHRTHRPFVRATLAAVIQRADELAEFLAIYWKDVKPGTKKEPLAKSVQKGLADAFAKFDAYQLAKYNRDHAVKLRDVLFLSHAKPSTEREPLYKQLVEGTLPTPDTWEVELSRSTDKRASWTRLLAEDKLGPLALLRNLRNLQQAGVPDAQIRAALLAMQPKKVLPFRFIAAARYARDFTAELELAMFRNVAELPKLPGETVVLVDVSGSMDDKLSDKSDLTRIDAAAGVAVFAREICQSARVYTFSDRTVSVPNYRGLALIEAIARSQPHSSTMLGQAVTDVAVKPYDRLIVLTDEQSHDRLPAPQGAGYVINVAPYQPGVGYGPWVHIDGFSERVIDFIRAVEADAA